jgi:NADH-quinone oxidoreductase subunit B
MKGETMEQDNLNKPGIEIPPELQNQVSVTTLDRVYNWCRTNSIWPMMFGLACCAIEMISMAASRFDISRFGMEVMRPSPRQADVMIVSGTVTKKMVPNIVRLYNQMGEPKYVIAMGACASGGGPFKEGYSVVSGIDRYIPVDVYIPGCPPTPQALLNGLLTLREKMGTETIKGSRWYGKAPVADMPVPILGPDLIDPRKYALIQQVNQHRAEEAAAMAAGDQGEIASETVSAG